MLQVIGHQVVECEPVVARYEIDALLGLSFSVAVNLGAADQPVSRGRAAFLLS